MGGLLSMVYGKFIKPISYMKYILIFLFIFMSGCAPKVPYDNVEKALLVAAVGGQVLDFHSTVRAINDGCEEANPLLGRNPNKTTLFVVKALAALAIWQMANYYEDRRVRKTWLTVMGFIGIAPAMHNYRLACGGEGQ